MNQGTYYEVHYSGWHLAEHIAEYFGPLVVCATTIFFMTRWKGIGFGGACAVVATLLLVAVPVGQFLLMLKGLNDLGATAKKVLPVFFASQRDAVLVWAVLLVAALWLGAHFNRRANTPHTPKIFD